MSYSLSILDKSPIAEGASAHDALNFTIALAKRAEALGYKRYWIAEHHGAPGLASSAPEIVVSHLLAHTSRIRVGSGGVMLQHYSPYKVAESFRVLASIAPGRVDLGVGKAPGGLPLSTRALQWFHDKSKKPDFAGQLAELDAFLGDGVAPDHPLAGALALPSPAEPPQRILLGGSPESAELAARHGWQFCYAGHFNGDVANIERSIDVYRDATGRVPLLALFAVAAGSSEDAKRQVGALRIFKLRFGDRQSVNLPSAEAAADFARQIGVTDYRIDELHPQVLAGTAQEVHRELDALHERFGIDEFVIDNPVTDPAKRLASVEALARVEQPIVV
ncbi:MULTISPECIES: LLM class flavin-dependent oxidoreductase [Burkholderia]|uniref:LLM class flavin-dependent oxidoreductase n=1 Tax=Burkholderia contaminans TaxID=488447 RepID=A0A2S5DNZ5_9BURK|nr:MULTISPECIES: LLM class flavin-dependent oxidoreductase [Burkholderia]EKS9793762.1 LLM class flavin-dependent oxidoreductase [Burkholderia cepacia]EKS9804557.1 LLM class flavin-dependent oxidoreductase [Burkholderia cepacia]EKS9811107.1 LLM class flavin-dependent oxidoreductase [Burkholderia cepacia]EKS9818730.1 LLM class flavin-dependent oxidoreductase [Burkholderia cepacia]EKS9829691.1 LLM class flavin-dependent oxidoreductase [Burkholderia cepacia]